MTNSKNRGFSGVTRYLEKYFRDDECVEVSNYYLISQLAKNQLGLAILPGTVAEAQGLVRVRDLRSSVWVKAVFHKEWLPPEIRQQILRCL